MALKVFRFSAETQKTESEESCGTAALGCGVREDELKRVGSEDTAGGPSAGTSRTGFCATKSYAGQTVALVARFDTLSFSNNGCHSSPMLSGKAISVWSASASSSASRTSGQASARTCAM